MKNAYTIIEIMIAVSMIAGLALTGFIIYGAIHFISKLW